MALLCYGSPCAVMVWVQFGSLEGRVTASQKSCSGLFRVVHLSPVMNNFCLDGNDLFQVDSDHNNRTWEVLELLDEYGHHISTHFKNLFWTGGPKWILDQCDRQHSPPPSPKNMYVRSLTLVIKKWLEHVTLIRGVSSFDLIIIGIIFCFTV